MKQILRRCVIDIGSGTTKMQIADVVVCKGLQTQINQIIDSRSERILYIMDQQKNNDILSDEIQEKGLNLMQEYIQIAQQNQSNQYIAFATQSLRKAKNGQSFIQKLQNTLGIKVILIDQQLEAKIGFQSALIESKYNQQDMISWDQGAGSFQISGYDQQRNFRSFMGNLGSGTMLAQALYFKNQKIGETPNPMNNNDVEQLVSYCIDSIESIPNWIKDKNQFKIIGIGGDLCAFNQARILTNANPITLNSVDLAIQMCLNKSDQQLTDLEQQNTIINKIEYSIIQDNAKYIIGKLSLMKGIMIKLGFQQIEYLKTIGGCKAILQSEEFWQTNN